MTQEDKQLLLTDLCARLPYGVIVCLETGLQEKLDMYSSVGVYIESCRCKPYLRPMLSMTKEEEDELCELCTLSDCNVNSDWEFCGVEIIHSHPRYGTYFSTDYSAINWLNKKMFDYRGLIPKGLANKAPDGMYNN